MGAGRAWQGAGAEGRGWGGWAGGWLLPAEGIWVRCPLQTCLFCRFTEQRTQKESEQWSPPGVGQSPGPGVQAPHLGDSREQAGWLHL